MFKALKATVVDEIDNAFGSKNVGLVIDGKPILRDVNLLFPAGEVVALVGHNGSGKSSLLKMLGRQIAPTHGTITFGGIDIEQYNSVTFARSVAYLPQDIGSGSDMTIRELVNCGRYPWHGALGRFSDLDRRMVQSAMVATHVEQFSERVVGTLSGGERQRAWIAMLIAQDARCFLLDEPTAALDIAHQVDVLSMVRRLAHENGRSVVIVLHDINMAARFCDRIHALREGCVVASGTPRQIVQPDTLNEIYGVAMNVVDAPGQIYPLAYVE